MSKLRILVLMDPVSTLNPDTDTSFALMLEAQARGHHVAHCEAKHLELRDGKAWAWVADATMQRSTLPPIVLSERKEESLSSFDIVLIRKDPPFDEIYHWATLVLEQVPPSTHVLNHPRGLRECNEKLYPCQFTELMPPTCVTASVATILAFVKSHHGHAVIKPLGGKGGEGIMALREGDLNMHSIVETLTHGGTQPVMVQAYLPASREGDKRILLLDGEPLGMFLRVPRADDLRSNIRVGGAPARVELSEADRKIVHTLKPHLQRDGLWFVGLDVIGGKLTEVNVTSPTGLQQISRLYDSNLATPVIESLERRHQQG